MLKWLDMADFEILHAYLACSNGISPDFGTCVRTAPTPVKSAGRCAVRGRRGASGYARTRGARASDRSSCRERGNPQGGGAAGISGYAEKAPGRKARANQNPANPVNPVNPDSDKYGRADSRADGRAAHSRAKTFARGQRRIPPPPADTDSTKIRARDSGQGAGTNARLRRQIKTRERIAEWRAAEPASLRCQKTRADRASRPAKAKST